MSEQTDDIEAGTCSACGRAAERGRSGAWWHVGDPCHGTPQTDGVPARPVTFQPARQQQSPRDRQVRDPRRNR